MSYEYEAKVVRVIDGDTVVLRLQKTYEHAVDFGFNIKDVLALTKATEMSFRLYGINAPEMKSETLVAGQASKAELERLLKLGTIRAVTYKADKYGRWLTDLYVTLADGTVLHVNKQLMESGHAVQYLL